jgi:dTDP-4-dehydrorhamnose reductase
MKLLVLGSKGQLGSDVVRVAGESGITCCTAQRSDADVADPAQVRRLLAAVQPDAVVNCTAFHDPVKCEEKPSVAVQINALAVGTMARICDELDIALMTISTDYVFDGREEEGYVEDDVPNPLMWYGRSKLAGEWCALGGNSKTFVVRSQSLYGLSGPSGKGLNFVDLMLKLSEERDELKVDQCRMSPTWTYALARNLIALVQTEKYGLYHMSCNGMTTWYEFARKIMELVGRTIKVTAVGNDFFRKTFKRPENTYLINRELAKIGLDLMPTWEAALSGYLKSKGFDIERDQGLGNLMGTDTR